MNNNVNLNNQKESLDFLTRLEIYKQNIEIVLNQLFSISTVIGLIMGLGIGYIGVKVAYIFLPLDAVRKDINDVINKLVDIFGLHFNVDIAYILACIFVALLLVGLAVPHKSKRMTKILKDLMITDNKKNNGNTAIYVKDRKYKRKSNVRVMTFIANGVIHDDFKEKNNLRRIGGKMKKYVINVEPLAKDENRLLLYYKKKLKYEIIDWKPEYIQQDDFSLVLGQNDMGELETTDLNSTAHLGIFGSTGSGKSVELASLCSQSLLKGAKVVIAEFSKRGIDWNYYKNLKNCDVYTKPDMFLEYLNSYIANQVEARADLLEFNNCKKIADYNKMIDRGEIRGEKLERIIIALDEAGQVFIPSLDKNREELLKPIRSAINKLITEYRFCGIHLFIASQIPSSKIFSEEIRHLTDLKLCGISTEILSEMAIGSDEASNILKKCKGRFITNEQKAFQGFMLNEDEVFTAYPKK